MKIIVVGCGRVGSALAFQLYQQGHRVTVIDQVAAAFENLPEEFRGRTVKGDVLVRNVLHRAEIGLSDALVAATSSDALNALVAYIAKTEFQLPRVVARNYDPSQRPIQEAFGVSVAASSTTGTQHIQELLFDSPLRALSFDRDTQLGLYQLQIPNYWEGHTLQDLLSGDSLKILAWVRDGQPVEITSNKPFQSGDLIMISANRDVAAALGRRLSSFEEQSS